MASTVRHPGSLGPRWEAPRSLFSGLGQFDGQVGAVVNVERHVVDPAVVSSEVAGQLVRHAQQMGMGAAKEVVGQSDREFGFESVKLGFTREAGSIRQQVSGR